MADFGKLNFAVSFNPQTAFPLDARYYFSSLSAAEAAAATAVEVGSSDGTYFYGENVCVVTESSADLYIIQPDKTLKAVGSAVLGDGKSIEIVDGKVALKGFGSATAGQQPRINAAGTAIEWYTPDTSTVSGLADTVAGHTQDIQNLQTGKADKATTLEGYGITDAMTATAIAEAIKTAIAETGANYVKSVSDEFTVSAEGKLEVKEVAPAKVTGLPDALAGKVDKVAGKGLSANDYTDEEKEKLGGVEAGANKNLIEIIKLAGAALNISEKAVNIPFAGDTAGVVTSSTGENKVAVAEDGSMEVNSLNMNKLVQSDGDTLILDGGNAAV